MTGNTSGRNGGFLFAYLSSASITVQNSTLSSNSAAADGGAVRVSGASSSLILTNNSFSNNSAGTTGGAVSVVGPLNVTKSTFTGNSSNSQGGAIYAANATTVNTSVFSNNKAGSGGIGSMGGGALRLSGGCHSINFSQFTNNTSAFAGGAIVTGSGTLTLNSVTFYQNSAATTGGAVQAGSSGGLTINQSTFHRNTAAGAGGGAIGQSFGPLVINNSTIYDNSATGSTTPTGGGGILRTSTATLNLISSVVSNNVVPNGIRGIDIYSTTATTVAGTNNLIGTNSNSSVTFSFPGSNQLGTNASKISGKLASLANNGGEAAQILPDGTFVKTMALQPGCLALNQGLANGFTNDQRGFGFTRNSGGGVDVGAFEGPATAPNAELTSAPGVAAAGSASHSFQVTFTDAIGFDTTSFGKSDVTVTGPGYSGGQIPTSFSVSGSGGTYVVTYTVPAPVGGWGNLNPSNTFNLGYYTVTLNASEVSNSSFTPISAGLLGDFRTAFAVTLLVSENSDADDGNYAPIKLSFREALQIANTHGGFADTIGFDSSVFNSPSTITLTAGPRTISDSVVINGPTASLTINANLTNQRITVAAATSVTISNLAFSNFSASSIGAVLFVSSATINLINASFSGNTNSVFGGVLATSSACSVTMSGCTFANNTTAGDGGALAFTFSNSLKVAISNSTFTGNSAAGVGGAIYGEACDEFTITGSKFSSNTAEIGGALWMNTNFGDLNVDGSTFTNNRATTDGGAAQLSGFAKVSNSTFSENSATGNGGALLLGAEELSLATITLSILMNNTASGAVGGGGAVYVVDAAGQIDSSQISKNTAAGSGGAINLSATGAMRVVTSTLFGNTAAGNGGAIHSTQALFEVGFSTLTGNTAGGTAGGGAISVTAGDLEVQGSTIYANTANGSATTSNGGGFAFVSPDELLIYNSIIAGNQITGAGTGGADIYSSIPQNLAVDSHHNLIGNNDLSNISFVDVTTNQLGKSSSVINPSLGPLIDNGGDAPLPDGSHPFTMAPLPGSPAINKAYDPFYAYDQRGAGFDREVGPNADIGAFEVQFFTPPTVSSVTFGDGITQRSMVKQITVTFSRPVAFSPNVASAFSLTRTGTGAPTGGVSVTASPATGWTNSVTLTFSGSLTDNGSLRDGLYDFVISAAVVSSEGYALDGNKDGIAGGNHTVTGTTANKYFRLFGDSDGSGQVDFLVDFIAFRNAFASGGPNPIFDFDNSNTVDFLVDFIQFRNRFNATP